MIDTRKLVKWVLTQKSCGLTDEQILNNYDKDETRILYSCKLKE